MGTLHNIVVAGMVAVGEATHEAGGGAHEAGGSILGQLGIQYPLIIAQSVGFLLLVVILTRFLYRPVLNQLDTREEEIRTRYKDAEKSRTVAEQIRREYDARIAQIDVEMRDRIQEGIREGQTMRTEIVSQAQQERERIIQQGHREVTEAHEKMLYSVRDKVATMAVDAAGRIISQSLDENTHRALIQEFLADLPAEQKSEAKS